jgi:hypothetical protein
VLKKTTTTKEHKVTYGGIKPQLFTKVSPL